MIFYTMFVFKGITGALHQVFQGFFGEHGLVVEVFFQRLNVVNLSKWPYTRMLV